ncbi:MAG TPA: rhomboid family intramembrane serine protease [Terriglobales bacterium]|jgi:membrane associated rhomboid family serine protease|nr:rhomboid family intramembrane serine protease [Terriglobales bacterium]
MTLSLPPFTRAVIWLLAANTAVFLLLELFSMALADVVRWVFDYLSLVPQQVVLHGWIWQLVTYSFIHAGFWHWFGNMIGIWMFGSAFEGAWGTRRFLELYGFGVIGAALTTIALSYTHVLGNPLVPTVGASGGVFAILIAFGVVFGENEILMIPFPVALKAKYFVAILIVVTLAFAIQGGGNVAYVAHLGGLFFGYIYVKFVPRSGLPQLGVSERYYGLRNGYYRWKRRRAARKFEVYMRKHDRTVSFDEQGNYIPPDEEKKNGGSKSGWVN